jgi:hypothetical protein
MTATFEIGKTYSVRSVCDYDCIFRFEVIGRTAQTVKIRSNFGVKSRGIRIVDGAEQILPLGRYSMAPVLRADKPCAGA